MRDINCFRCSELNKSLTTVLATWVILLGMLMKKFVIIADQLETCDEEQPTWNTNAIKRFLVTSTGITGYLIVIIAHI